MSHDTSFKGHVLLNHYAKCHRKIIITNSQIKLHITVIVFRQLETTSLKSLPVQNIFKNHTIYTTPAFKHVYLNV